ncbi:MAG: CDP-alcohol phosphatidyltransferase family protein, partial [Pseudomonadota bacterium]
MAFTHHDILRLRRRGFALFVPAGPTGEFVRAAVAGGVGVLALGFVLLGVSAGALAGALVFYALAAGLAGIRLYHHYPHARLGLCNHVTLARLVLVGGLVAPLLAGVGPSWAFFALAAVALSLDGIDGWLARRQ